ncbi:putrescine transport system permease protein [Palleronia marisminoris]|uniref:Inner membrane ABC transporter permease protein YdcV n=1 Tax=Palleronia marisminoris TaxID=315423 RepID=A0A1Y5RBH7_9RHOB|nr:ABC transporter permease subunit [Palleronia marisminoris]SFG10883.1 putrescine transport system permease protein [Palleronia marisminoris]SLN13469.1 Inner membrane ABC transporter permease protein YdcV [Palleronia marisminoris]
MRSPVALRIVVVAGFLFLYAPILSLVIYSFNESRLVTVWSGFSLKWYGELLSDPQIIGAAWISLKVAFLSASIATVLGTLAALVLVRGGRGRAVLGGLVTAPLVMPEVIIGLSLLLLFVAMEGLIGWPGGRGLLTIVIAHATFGAAFATVVIEARMVTLDRAVEDAAQDLGAGPLRVFFDVTLPALAPALVSAWLLAFTLSLDDVVIASFVAGPGSSTLPMVIFSKVRLGVSPEVNALATLVIVLVSCLVLIAAWVSARQRVPEA